MPLRKIDDLIERGVIHSVYVGRSVTDQKRFATLRRGAGETVASGQGDTCEAALQDAVSRIGTQRPVNVETPVMPGITTR